MLPTVYIMCAICMAGVIASLELNPDFTQNSFVLEKKTVFLGEFPKCVAVNISGNRTFLRFGSEILNTGDLTVFRTTPPRLDYTVGNLSGNITLPCLRDSRCVVGSPTYYRCTPPAVSPNCSSIVPNVADCHWIDITTLSGNEFTLKLTLESQDHFFPLSIDEIPEESRHSTARIVLAVTLLLVSNLMIICLPYALFREVTTHKEKKSKST